MDELGQASQNSAVQPRFQLTIRPLVGGVCVLDAVSPTDTVSAVKDRVERVRGYDARQQRFRVNGHRLGPEMDHLTLAECGIAPARNEERGSDEGGEVDNVEVTLLLMALHTCMWPKILDQPRATWPAPSLQARRTKLDVKRKMSELSGERWFAISPMPNTVEGDLPSIFQVTLQGFKGTPYEGGTFVLDVEITHKYPFNCPNLCMRTPIYHPTVKASGAVTVLKVSKKEEADQVANRSDQGWTAEVVSYDKYWSPQNSFLDVVELIYRQLQHPPSAPCFSVVCGYRSEEWTGRTMLDMVTRHDAKYQPTPPETTSALSLFRQVGVLRKRTQAAAGSVIDRIEDEQKKDEEVRRTEEEQTSRLLVERKAKALTRFHAVDGDYVWHESDHAFLPPEMKRDVLLLLLIARRGWRADGEVARLPWELVRMLIQCLARLHREENKHVVWWPLQKHHHG